MQNLKLVALINGIFGVQSGGSMVSNLTLVVANQHTLSETKAKFNMCNVIEINQRENPEFTEN